MAEKKNKYIKYIQGDFDTGMTSLKVSLSNLLYGLLKQDITEYHLKTTSRLRLSSLSTIIEALFEEMLTDFWSSKDSFFMTVTSLEVEDLVVVAEEEKDGVSFKVVNFEDWKKTLKE